MSWSKEQVHAFLTEETRIARLATASADGAPHVVPVWFRLAGDEIRVHTQGESTKAANIRANPRFALAVDKPTPPYKGVTLFGTAEVVGNDVVDSIALAKELALEHMGPEAGPGYGEFVAAMPGEHVALVLRPERWEAWDFSQA